MEGSTMYPKATREIVQERDSLVPEAMKAWEDFSNKVFDEGALPQKTKQLIALAVAHVTQCPYCIRAHTKGAMHKGASKEEMMEAIMIAAEMRSGAAIAHATIAIDEMEK